MIRGELLILCACPTARMSVKYAEIWNFFAAPASCAYLKYAPLC